MVTKNPDDQLVKLQVDNCNPVTTLDSILTFVTEACPQTYFINGMTIVPGRQLSVEHKRCS